MALLRPIPNLNAVGANAEAIATAEDRELFKQAMIEIGLRVPRSGTAHTMDEARRVMDEIGLPIIIRPAYILGGRGTGIASSAEEFEHVAANGLASTLTGDDCRIHLPGGHIGKTVQVVLRVRFYTFAKDHVCSWPATTGKYLAIMHIRILFHILLWLSLTSLDIFLY